MQGLACCCCWPDQTTTPQQWRMQPGGPSLGLVVAWFISLCSCWVLESLHYSWTWTPLKLQSRSPAAAIEFVAQHKNIGRRFVAWCLAWCLTWWLAWWYEWELHPTWYPAQPKLHLTSTLVPSIWQLVRCWKLLEWISISSSKLLEWHYLAI